MKTTVSQQFVSLMAAVMVTLGMLGGVDHLARAPSDAAASAGWAAGPTPAQAADAADAAG